MEDTKDLIDFKFEWTGKDYDKIAPNVIETAKKLLELNLIKVKPELNENGNVVIQHTGVCKKQGLVESLASGIVNENIYSYTFNTNPKNSLNCICQGRNDSKVNFCKMSSCPIVLAGYLYYIQNRNDSTEQIVKEFSDGATENDIYARNYNELKKMELDADIEDFLSPLAVPSIKGLRCAFIGEEGTDKEGTIKKIANYLYRIGKISNENVANVSLSYIGDPNTKFLFQDDRLYSIGEIQDYLDTIANNDDFSGSAEAGRKINKNSIKKIVNQAKGKYIIINTSPLELKKFLATNAKLPYIFENTIYFKDYEDDRILKMFEENLPEYHRKLIKEDTRKSFLAYLERNRKYFPFKNEDLSLFLAGYVSRKNEISLPKERYDESTLEDMFKNLIGMNNVKQQLRELNNFLLLKNKLEKQSIKFPNFNLHMMFLGNPGTGKTTVARMVAKTLFDLGYIKENKCIEVESKDLIAAFSGQTPIKTNRVVNSALGGVLFIDEAYSLAQASGSAGAEAIATLVKAMEDNKGELVVIFAGYSKEMQEFIQANSGIQSRIGYTFEFADYTEDELYEIFKLKSEKINLSIDEKAEERIKELINFGKNRKNFGNGRYIDNILQKTITKHASLELKDKDLLKLTRESIPSIEEVLTQSSGERHPEKIEELFQDIVGMENVKKQVVELGKYVKFRDELSKISQNSLPNMRLHMLFTGDAGTGKTTMARKITEMLYNIGCIRINKLVEVERKDLVGEYIGQTAPKTEKVIEGALGGVLFIDEAYSLTPKDSFRDFGQEAITTLIKAMENYRDELVVIFAGYTKEMKDFVNSNSGIASRIGYTFEFKNYKDEELYKILEIKCNQYNLIITDDVKEKVMEVFKYFSSVENFGNGRFVDKFLQEILVKHSQNDKLENNINILLTDDIPSIKDMIEKTFNNRDNLVIPADIDTETRRKIAIHEMGHAIIYYLYNGETDLKVITVIPEGNGALGYVLHTNPKTKVIWRKRDYLDTIEVSLAGRAAEEVMLGTENVSSGCWEDLEKATQTLTNMLNDCGMSETLGLISARSIKPSLDMTQKLDNEKKKILEDCYANVKKVLQDNKKMFDKVLKSLMEKGTITGEEFVKLIKEN